jgi:hypothetical protein
LGFVSDFVDFFPFCATTTQHRTETTINLLDWNEDNGPSPLKNSLGWVDTKTYNKFVSISDKYPGVSTNGLPMSEDFDLAIYIKGDQKPTTIYSATLLIEYDSDTSPVDPTDYDLVIDSLSITPARPVFGKEFTATFNIYNAGTTDAKDQSYMVSYTDNKGGTDGAEIKGLNFSPGEKVAFTYTQKAPAPTGSRGNIQARITVTVPNDDVDNSNNEAVIDFQIKKK